MQCYVVDFEISHIVPKATESEVEMLKQKQKHVAVM